MAADDNDVRGFRIGSFDHQRSGVAFPNEVLGGDPHLSRARDDPRKGRFALASNLVDPSVKEATREPEARRIDHADEDQASSDSRRQLDTGSLRASGCPARIGCNQHSPRKLVCCGVPDVPRRERRW